MYSRVTVSSKQFPAESPPAIGSSQRSAHPTDDTPTLPLPRVRLPTGEIPTLPLMRAAQLAREAPTLSLTPVELEAIVQAADLALAPRTVEAGTPTVESVRIAKGSSELPPARLPVASAPSSARGPRRPRETLRADSIKLDPDAPPRKR